MTYTTPQHLERATLEALARLTATHRDIRAAHSALRDAQPGYPTASGGGGNTPTLDAAGNPPGLDRHLGALDLAATDQRQLVALVRQLGTVTTQLYDIVVRWTHTPTSLDAPKRQVSGGDCVACGAFCSGAVNDRLRAGLCVACYHHHRRWATETGGDRGDCMLVRRRELEDTDDDAA